MDLNPAWRAELADAFDRFDTDEDGTIDRREFNLLLDDLGSDLSERDRDIGFALVDEDENGRIDFDELANWWEVVREEGT